MQFLDPERRKLPEESLQLFEFLVGAAGVDDAITELYPPMWCSLSRK